MAKDRKITARLNPLITCMLLLPAIIFGRNAYESYQRIKTGVTSEDESYYHVYTALGRYSYPKESIDGTRDYSGKNSELKQVDELLQEAYASSVELAKEYHREQRWMFLILSGLAVAFFVFAISYRRVAYAELSGDALTLRLPPMGRKTTVKIGNIRAIHIKSVVPLVPSHTDISRVNWRDNVWLTEKNGDMIIVSLLVFPAFRKIVEEITAKNPKIPVTFPKGNRKRG